MDVHAIAAIAGQELRIHVRNRWILTFAVVFAILTVAIAYFGMVTSALVGFQSFTRTSASLLNLVLYLVPLVSLSLATLSFTGERGGMELLFAQPVTRVEILLGKTCGLFGSMLVATLFGFGASGLIIGWEVGSEGAGRYLLLVAFTLLLALAFISLGTLISTLVNSRSKALGLALGLWFFFVLFYDLLVIGAAFVFRQHTANLIIFLSLFGNPVDLARVSSLMALGSPTVFGAAGSALLKFLHGIAASIGLMSAALTLWTAVPMAFSAWALRSRDI